MRRRRIHSLSRKMTQMVKQYMVYTFQVLVTIYIYRLLPVSNWWHGNWEHYTCILCPDDDDENAMSTLCPCDDKTDVSENTTWVCIYIIQGHYVGGCTILYPDNDENMCVCALFCAQTTMKTLCGCVHYCVSRRCWEYPVGVYITHMMSLYVYIYISHIYIHTHVVFSFLSSSGHRMHVWCSQLPCHQLDTECKSYIYIYALVTSTW